MTDRRKPEMYMIDAAPRQKILKKNRRIDDQTTKKFLTNSDKSIFNLRWEVGGVAEQNYQRSRSHSQHEKSNYYQKRPAPHNESMPGTSYQASPKPNVHYDPYAGSQNRIKQSEKPVNLPRNPNELRIEQYYVDSPNEGKKLIDDLQRKGFVETGISTHGVYSNHKKK